jgi:hypothetical protein
MISRSALVTGLREMKNPLANNGFVVTLSIVAAVAGFVVGYVRRDFYWFARFGALVVGFGIALVSRTAFTGRDLLLNVTAAATRENINSPEHFMKLGEPIPAYVATDVAARKAINLFGPAITFVGTAIWGFGDLLNNLFHFAGK